MAAPKRNRFIDDEDLSESTSLIHMLEKHDAENNEETRVIKHSPFYSEQKFKTLLKKEAGMCILDLNIANIFTKFDET